MDKFFLGLLIIQERGLKERGNENRKAGTNSWKYGL
jgi:hypothetical protein